MNGWVREHEVFGDLNNNWHLDGSIDHNAKRMAIIVIAATPVVTWLLGVPSWVVAFQIVVLSAAAIFILTRPSPAENRP